MATTDSLVSLCIPARYGSSRFPGKPLALLAGKPLIQHVYEGDEAKYYKITRQGRQVLASETESWDRLVGAIGLILRGEAQS
jgi:3-deoxy-manno-octulosonate cytidylyltransferase (CMP-KDO synthetase)